MGPTTRRSLHSLNVAYLRARRDRSVTTVEAAEDDGTYIPAVRYPATHGPVVAWDGSRAVYHGAWRQLSREPQP